MQKSLFVLSATCAFVSFSHATLLTDNFDSYTPLATMQGLGAWSVMNDLAGTDPIAIATDFTFDGSDGAALIGGLDPNSAGPTVLSAGSSVPAFNAGFPSLFSIDFGFLDSTGANRDDYSIALSSTGGNLLSINLTPGANVNTYNIGFSSDFFTDLPNWGTLDALDTASNPYFKILFATSTDGFGGMFYSLTDGFAGSISSGALTGMNITDNITGLAISVDTGGAGGDGFLVVDNVNVIPEPSSALLGLLGASFALLRRRRA